MTMLITFLDDYKDVDFDFAAGESAYIRRQQAIKLCNANVAKPYSVYLKEQKEKSETQVSKTKTEKAVVTPEPEKAELPKEDKQCKGYAASGKQCKATAKDGSDYCWRHEKGAYNKY